ncbi:MAG: hypothetical protein HYU36_19370 [Planctomycetes bacterium]|nr:hypothetical protein [Planctomycetota bacterium]
MDSWELPWLGGEPGRVVLAGGKAFLASGSGGLLSLSVEGGRMGVESAAGTPGRALDLFLQEGGVLVYTDQRILQAYSRNADGRLEAGASVFLGAWDLLDVAVERNRLFYLRKIRVERAVRENKFEQDLYFIGCGEIRRGLMKVEGEVQLGIIRPHRVMPLGEGRWAAVSLGEQGLALVEFEPRNQPRVREFLGQVGDVRSLGLAGERRVLAGAARELVVWDLENLLEERPGQGGGDAPEGDLADAEGPGPEGEDGKGEEAAESVRRMPLPGRPMAFASRGDHHVALLESGEVLVLESAEVGNEWTLLARVSESPSQKDSGRAVPAASMGVSPYSSAAIGDRWLVVSDSQAGLRLFDAAEPARPKLVHTLAAGDTVRDLACVGSELFALCGGKIGRASAGGFEVFAGVAAPAGCRLASYRGFLARVSDAVSWLPPQSSRWEGEPSDSPGGSGPAGPARGLAALLARAEGAAGAAGRDLEGPGELRDFAFDGGRLFLLWEDLFEEAGKRPVSRACVSVVGLEEGAPRRVSEFRVEGLFPRRLAAGGDLVVLEAGGWLHLWHWPSGKRLQVLYGAAAVESLAVLGHRILASGPDGLKVFDVRDPSRPRYLSALRMPEVRKFALSEDGGRIFGFTGNRLLSQLFPAEGTAASRTAFEVGPVRGRNGTPVALGNVEKLYGREFAILEDGVDVCSEVYARQRGYRLRAVGRRLDEASGWPDTEVDPDTVAVDPERGRVKFSDGTPCLFERLSQVATPMYNSSGWERRGNRLYVATGENANPFVIYDAADPAFPKEIGWCPGGVRFPHDIAASEDNQAAYLPVTTGPLEVLDVSKVGGSAYEIVRVPAREVCTWTPPGAGKSFRLELVSGGNPPAERLQAWTPPGGDAPVSAAVSGDFLYVSGRAYFYVLDIRDRLSPRLLGQCPGGGGDITAVQDGYAYLSTGGLTVVDVRHPDRPKVAGSLSNHRGRPLALLGRPARGFAGMAFVEKHRGQHFVLADVRDPARPRVAGVLEDAEILNTSGAAILEGGRALITDAGSWGGDYNVVTGMHGRMVLLDISDPASIRNLSTFHSPDEGDWRGIEVDEEQHRAWIGDRSFGVWVYDVHDPARPELLGGVPVSGESDYGYFKDGVLYFDTTGGGGLWAVDVTDPFSPKKVGYYWDGIWTPRSHHQGAGNALYTAMTGTGLRVLDVADPHRIRLAAELRLNLLSQAFKVHGDRLFALTLDRGRTGMVEYRLEDPLSPREEVRQELNLPPGPMKFDFAGDDLVVVSLAKGQEHLQLLRTEGSGGRWKELARLDLASAVTKPSGWDNWDVQAVGDRLFVTGDGLMPPVVVIDLTDRKSPAVVWASPLDTPDRFMDARVVGDYLYANWYYPGIQVYDFRDPAHPVKLACEPSGPGGEFSKDAWSLGVVSGPYLYAPKLSFAVVFRVPRAPQTPRGEISVR